MANILKNMWQAGKSAAGRVATGKVQDIKRRVMAEGTEILKEANQMLYNDKVEANILVQEMRDAKALDLLLREVNRDIIDGLTELNKLRVDLQKAYGAAQRNLSITMGTSMLARKFGSASANFFQRGLNLPPNLQRNMKDIENRSRMEAANEVHLMPSFKMLYSFAHTVELRIMDIVKKAKQAEGFVGKIKTETITEINRCNTNAKVAKHLQAV